MRFILSLLFIFSFPFWARAKDFTDKYIPVDLRALTLFAGNYGTFNLQDNAVFAEYLQITECDIYQSVRNSQFKQQEIRQAILERKAKSNENKELFFRIPVSFRVTNYNFDTQSLTLEYGSQMRKVNSFVIGDRLMPVCEKTIANDLRSLPYSYQLKANFPVSLYRIPIKKDLAENLFDRLDAVDDSKVTRLIYGNLYLQIDPIQPKIKNDGISSSTSIFGQVNAIDLYKDQDRTVLLKRLDYSQQ